MTPRYADDRAASAPGAGLEASQQALGKLTPGEQRILTAVRERSPRIFNGRAFRQIDWLEALGLVTADWDLIIMASKRTRWRITVTLREESNA